MGTLPCLKATKRTCGNEADNRISGVGAFYLLFRDFFSPAFNILCETFHVRWFVRLILFHNFSLMMYLANMPYENCIIGKHIRQAKTQYIEKYLKEMRKWQKKIFRHMNRKRLIGWQQ